MQTRRPGRAVPDGIAPKDSLPDSVGAMPHVHALRDADLFAALIENCPDVIFIKDTLGIYQACNHVAAEMLGRSKSEIIGKSDAELFPPDVAERHREMDRIVLDTQACHAEDQCQAREDGGAARTIEMMKSPLRRADGTVIGILGIGRDVTERRKLNESLRLADLLYRTTSEAILIIDDRDIVMDANPAFLRLLGYTLEEVVGTLPSRFVGASFDPARRDAITRTLERDGHWEGELRLFRKDGQGIDVYADVNVMFDAASNIFRRAVHIRDLTEYKSKDAQIWRQANFDQLTGLPNRSLLLDRLGQCMVTAKVSGCSIGLLCIDLDRFAAINGLMGHANGDAVLVQTARRVQGCLPEGATVARLASDRFAAFLAGPRSQLEQKAAVLIEVLAAPFQLGLETVHVTASIGMTVYPDDGADALALMNGAEQAIAIAKRAGGNRFQCFAPAMQEGALAKARLTHELRQAIDRGELHMYYQPIVNVRTGRIDKAEALLRWIRPVQGVIGPACFIPLAEEGGLIVRIGDWVIEQAIASVERWRRELGVDIELSVNQSPMQFDKTAGSHWMERLAAAELPPHSITVEITESMLVNDTGRMHASLSFLRANGAKVSLDDFGTGYSALSYLKRFDVDYLKIDKSFVQNIEQDADDCTLIQGIIELAHRLRIETIAEGVETRGQRDILTQSGCDYLQGYFYSRPVARDDFERMLEKSTRKKAFQQPPASGAR